MKIAFPRLLFGQSNAYPVVFSSTRHGLESTQRGLANTHAEPLRILLSRLSLLEMARPVLARALEPFPIPVRTLDALHLASVEFLRDQGQDVALASYDTRICDAAVRMGVALFDMP